MDLKLQDKTAVVSGSTGGIGFAIALGLAKEGASVVLNGRSEERVSSAVDRIARELPNTRITGVAGDLSTDEGVAELFKRVPETDILVNNLGIFEPKPFAEITDDDWRRFFEVNVLSGVRLSRQYLPGMMRNNWGRIIFISSESALNVPAEMIHYGMTKTAQLAVSRGLAELTVGTNVTVNTVLPGPTKSEGVEAFVEGLATQNSMSTEQFEKAFFETARPGSLIKRFLSPEEIAALVIFIASPLSSATNGAALRAEGGLVKSIT
jgi:NAD(P)-dependent dehydrogenase (short-subunit alcohol dehydrogenase family)